jgi:hypothetical protein
MVGLHDSLGAGDSVVSTGHVLGDHVELAGLGRSHGVCAGTLEDNSNMSVIYRSFMEK